MRLEKSEEDDAWRAEAVADRCVATPRHKNVYHDVR